MYSSLLFLTVAALPEPASWSLGAGVSLSPSVVVPLAGVGLGALGRADPSLSVTVEHRMGDATWLMFRGTAGVGSTTGGGVTAGQQRAGGSAGLRQMLAGGGPVALSAFG